MEFARIWLAFSSISSDTPNDLKTSRLLSIPFDSPSARPSLRACTFMAAKWSSSSSVKTISLACSLISLSGAEFTRRRLIASEMTLSSKSGRQSALPACLSRYSQRSSVVQAVYEVKVVPEYAFTVSGFGYGRKIEDIKVKGPSDCFDISTTLFRGGIEEELEEVTSVQKWIKHHVQMKVSVTCDDDSLGNIWAYLARENPEELSVKVNGKEVKSFYGYVYYYLYPVSFVGLNGKIISSQMVEEGESATLPEAPEEKGYVFTGWDSDDYKKVTDSRTIHAEYEKVESSSSAEGKSSSSKGKTGIVPVGHALQFSLAAVGRNIQVSGATVGGAYAVFDMQGRVLRQGRVESANFDMTFANAGTYLVRIAGQSATVRLR